MERPMLDAVALRRQLLLLPRGPMATSPVTTELVQNSRIAAKRAPISHTFSGPVGVSTAAAVFLFAFAGPPNPRPASSYIGIISQARVEPEKVRLRSLPSAGTSKFLDEAFAAAEFEDDTERVQASAAVKDAKSFIAVNPLFRPPDSTSFGDSGVLSLKWSKRRSGVLVMFSGGSVMAYALKKANSHYADSIVELSLEGTLPGNLKRALRYI